MPFLFKTRHIRVIVLQNTQLVIKKRFLQIQIDLLGQVAVLMRPLIILSS